MYFPYFRGRREELSAIRSTLKMLATNKEVMPIIEPVRDNASAMVRCAKECNATGVKLGFIVNPSVGDLVTDAAALERMLSAIRSIVIPFYLIGSSTTPVAISKFIATNKNRNVGFVHFLEPKNGSDVLKSLTSGAPQAIHLFVDGGCSSVYMDSIKGSTRALVHDGFNYQNRNADYPTAPEFFSDLHSTYKDKGFSGFGDFLTIGKGYIKGGGAPRAIALHLTAENKGGIYCYHFISTSNTTPSNRDRKYREALNSLNDFCTSSPTVFYKSTVLEEFLQDHKNGTTTSLGMMKRRSMRHHLEMMCQI